MKHPIHFLPLQLLFSVILLISTSQAQVYPTGVSTEEYERLNSFGVVFVKGLVSDEFDTAVEDALASYWTFSDYRVVDTVEYNRIKNKNSLFFLRSTKVRYDKYASIEDGGAFIESHLYGNVQIIPVSGGDVKTINPRFKSVPTTTASVFCSLSRKIPVHFIPVLIKNLNLQCTEAKLDKYTKGRSRMRKMNRYNKLIKTKPLYILESDLNDKIKSIEDVKKHYDGEVYVVSLEEYTKLIEDNADVNLVYVINDSTQNYVQVFEQKTGRCLYYKRSVVHPTYPAGVIRYHIKKWN